METKNVLVARKRRRVFRRYRSINQVLAVKISLMDRVKFPTQAGQPVFGLSGNSVLNMQTLLNNSQFATFGSMFGVYKMTGVALEVTGQGPTAAYDYPAAIALFPSGTGNLVIQWSTVRAADMCVMLNPYGRIRKYFRLRGNPYKQVDAVAADMFVIAAGAQANATEQVNLTFNVKIDVYFRFKQLKV